MKKILTLFCIFLYISSYSTIELELDAAVTAKAFNRATGTLYLGLNGGNEQAISQIKQYNGSETIKLTGIAQNSLLNNANIEFLTLSESEGDTNPYLIIVKRSNLGAFRQTKIILATNDGTIVHELEANINDASGVAVTHGIVNIEANNNYVFAAVKGNGSPIFGNNNSGIAIIKIDKINHKLIIQDATTGNNGNRALLLNGSITEIKGSGQNVTFGQNKPNFIPLKWNEQLQKLYIGYDITTNTNNMDRGISLLIANIDSTDNNKLKFLSATNPNNFTGNNNKIIGIRDNERNLKTLYIDEMNTNVGPNYLIIQSNVGPNNGDPSSLNTIFAVPLINNPIDTVNHGRIARKNSALNNELKFTIAPTSNGHLPSSTDNETKVGGGPLPLQTTQSISDIMVINNTVYVSISEPQSSTNDSGIFYSQALFNETGKIIQWTKWKKRAFPFNGFPLKNIVNPLNQPRIQFFSIDAKNGKIFAIDGNTNTTLASLQWTDGSQNKKSLIYNLNQNLKEGCFCSLDLHQNTRGLSTNCPGRYALFGGLNKVIFVRTSISKETTGDFTIESDSIPASQTIPTDYTTPENFFLSTLPSEAGPVTSLEYSRRLTASTNQNYFFAGTENGLYAFTDSSGTGFTPSSTVSNLNATPFLAGVWRKINGIEGQVTSIKTSGIGPNNVNNGALYILTLELTNDPEYPFNNSIYRMRYNSTATLMEENIEKIAETKTFATGSDLTDTLFFYDIAILSTNTDGDEEELIIATNNGLYKSNTNAGSGIASDANNQTDALWQKIDGTDLKLYYNLFDIDNLTKTMFWPTKTINLTTISSQTQQFYGNNIIGGETQTILTQNPSKFINKETNFSNLQFTKKFWTDGARRFFITEKNTNEFTKSTKHKIISIPFNSTIWNINNESDITLSESIFNEENLFFYWIQQIGASGTLMIGTNQGIISLE